MRALVQRVTRAAVEFRPSPTDGWETAGSIGPGLCVLVGVTHSDDDALADKLADKLWGLRIFDDDAGVMNRSVADVSSATPARFNTSRTRTFPSSSPSSPHTSSVSSERTVNTPASSTSA